MYVTRLDAVPPGQHATRISPTVAVVGKFNRWVPMQYLRETLLQSIKGLHCAQPDQSS
jgi:multidrug resistance efflux pump